MILADAATFFGRFHPLLVHLPIGFLLLAMLLALLGLTSKYQAVQPAVSFALLAGMLCAVFACITGYILSLSGDYDQDTLSVHLTGGLCTAGVSALAYLVSIRKLPFRFLNTQAALLVTLFTMAVVISVTGHYGGTLTHGAGYLSSDLLFRKQQVRKELTDINEALVYEDIVQPILQKKCSNCHNNSKKKGELSLETYKALLKGGKHGTVIELGDAGKSELISRVNLNPKDEKFMPSDGKPPLSEEEKNILTWWIQKAAATETKKVKELAASAAVKKDIIAYLGLEINGGDDLPENTNDTAYAQLMGAKITDLQLDKLRKAGFVIKHINLQPVLLDVSLPEDMDALPATVTAKLKELLAVKDHIIWLNVAGNNISDDQLEPISLLKNLQRLRLDKNAVTDAGMTRLQTLKNLESINLYNTKVSAKGLSVLSSLTKLKTMYVWGTGVRKEDIPAGLDSTINIVTGIIQ